MQGRGWGLGVECRWWSDSSDPSDLSDRSDLSDKSGPPDPTPQKQRMGPVRCGQGRGRNVSAGTSPIRAGAFAGAFVSAFLRSRALSEPRVIGAAPYNPRGAGVILGVGHTGPLRRGVPSEAAPCLILLRLSKQVKDVFSSGQWEA